jgi:hypothetical protein
MFGSIAPHFGISLLCYQEKIIFIICFHQTTIDKEAKKKKKKEKRKKEKPG